MRVLVVGSGGREHALCWKLATSPLLTKLWCAPGNPGTAECAENLPIDAMDIAGLARFAAENAVDLVVPGPEAPLAAGLADALGLEGVRCCGPSAAAARLESSKSFTKEICAAAAIPTALWERFTDAHAARDFVRRRGAPIVVKADGLAGGKGVVVAASVAEAEEAVARFIAAGPVVIEECLFGEEISFFALCDGSNAIPLGAARDYKRAGDGDTGPNTGGMGAYSPVAAWTPALEHAAMARIVAPTLAEMQRQGTPFRGVLFAGLMLTEHGPKLIEFNARFGDPECQVLMLRLRSDLLPALLAACDGELRSFDLAWSADAAVAVVMAARGYPEAPETGSVVGGLAAVVGQPSTRVFYAAAESQDGTLVATGGRVLTLCGIGLGLHEAHDAAYAAAAALDWPDGFCRRDIATDAM